MLWFDLGCAFTQKDLMSTRKDSKRYAAKKIGQESENRVEAGGHTTRAVGLAEDGGRTSKPKRRVRGEPKGDPLNPQRILRSLLKKLRGS
jgi:hypothetical protein